MTVALIGFSCLFVLWFTAYVVTEAGSGTTWVERLTEALIGAFGMVILGIICLGFAWLVGTGI